MCVYVLVFSWRMLSFEAVPMAVLNHVLVLFYVSTRVFQCKSGMAKLTIWGCERRVYTLGIANRVYTVRCGKNHGYSVASFCCGEGVHVPRPWCLCQPSRVSPDFEEDG